MLTRFLKKVRFKRVDLLKKAVNTNIAFSSLDSIAEFISDFDGKLLSITPSDPTKNNTKMVELFADNLKSKVAAMSTAEPRRRVSRKSKPLTASSIVVAPDEKERHVLLSVRFAGLDDESDWGLSVVRKHFPRLCRYIHAYGKRKDNPIIDKIKGFGRADLHVNGTIKVGEGRVHAHMKFEFSKPISKAELAKIKAHLLKMLPPELVNDETVDIEHCRSARNSENYVYKNAKEAKRSGALKGVRLTARMIKNRKPIAKKKDYMEEEAITYFDEITDDDLETIEDWAGLEQLELAKRKRIVAENDEFFRMLSELFAAQEAAEPEKAEKEIAEEEPQEPTAGHGSNVIEQPYRDVTLLSTAGTRPQAAAGLADPERKWMFWPWPRGPGPRRLNQTARSFREHI